MMQQSSHVRIPLRYCRTVWTWCECVCVCVCAVGVCTYMCSYAHVCVWVMRMYIYTCLFIMLCCVCVCVCACEVVYSICMQILFSCSTGTATVYPDSTSSNSTSATLASPLPCLVHKTVIPPGIKHFICFCRTQQVHPLPATSRTATYFARHGLNLRSCGRSVITMKR